MTISPYLTPISKPQSSELIIYPYQGVGQIRFGMTREEVRSLLGKPSATFYKTPFSQNSTDAFDAVGVHVHYHSADYCESLEFFEPAKLLLGKTHIFDLSFTEVREWLESDDSELEIDDEGLTCFKYGVGIYAPDWQEDPNLLIEGVIVFNDRDYYNS